MSVATTPNNVPSSISIPSNAPADFMGVAMVFTQLGTAVGSWIGAAATAINYLLGTPGTYVGSTVGSANDVPLSNATAANVTSITLAAGDWDISGNVYFLQSSAGLATQLIGVILPTSDTISATANTLGVTGFTSISPASGGTGAKVILPLSPLRVVLTQSTVYYLIAQATFGSGSVSAYGTVQARRWK